MLRARGLERKELLSVIAAELDNLNDSFHLNKENQAKVEKLVPCNCKQCSSKDLPEFFEQKRLLQRKSDRKLKVECPGSYIEVDVLELLDGIKANITKWPDSKSERTAKTLKVFISYSHAQCLYYPTFRADFEQYAKLPGLDIQIFGDEAIPFGAAWDVFLHEQVAECDMMLLLVSQEFLNSEYIQEKEFGAAINRLKKGHKLVIAPVYFTPCFFDFNEEMARLQFFKPHGQNYGQAQKGERFAYIDLIEFNRDIQAIPNSNRQHYMMDLVRKLEPSIYDLLGYSL